MIRRAGFQEVQEVGYSGFDSSPVTKGALFKAVKGSSRSIGSD